MTPVQIGKPHMATMKVRVAPLFEASRWQKRREADLPSDWDPDTEGGSAISLTILRLCRSKNINVRTADSQRLKGSLQASGNAASATPNSQARPIRSRPSQHPEDQEGYTMNYTCFKCNKTIDHSFLRKRIRCPYCGSKILFKPRKETSKVQAR